MKALSTFKVTYFSPVNVASGAHNNIQAWKRIFHPFLVSSREQHFCCVLTAFEVDSKTHRIQIFKVASLLSRLKPGYEFA